MQVRAVATVGAPSQEHMDILPLICHRRVTMADRVEPKSFGRKARGSRSPLRGGASRGAAAPRQLPQPDLETDAARGAELDASQIQLRVERGARAMHGDIGRAGRQGADVVRHIVDGAGEVCLAVGMDVQSCPQAASDLLQMSRRYVAAVSCAITRGPSTPESHEQSACAVGVDQLLCRPLPSFHLKGTAGMEDLGCAAGEQRCASRCGMPSKRVRIAALPAHTAPVACRHGE